MADVSVKMGVSGISQFKQGMQQAQQSVKTMDAALKKNEAQLKASGNAEQYMATKSDLLKQKLDAQKKEVDQANKALQVLVRSGVDPASKEYQKMAQSLLNAETAMIDTQTQIRNLGNETANTAEKASKLETSLGGLNKKVSLQQVNSAVKSISSGLEQAAKKAVELGKQLWDNIIDTASYSDDVATAATRMGMSTKEYQQLKGVLDTVGDMTVEEWKKAKRKVQSAIYSQTDEQADVLKLLGIDTHEGSWGKEGWVQGAARDAEDVLWDLGEAIRRDVASGKISYDQAETWSNLFFGKGYDSLNGVFSMGREAFNEALEVQKTATEEALKNNAALNDKVIQLENTFQALKVELLGGLSPTLTKVADAINGVLGSLMDYLQTPEGQQKLEELGEAISSIFGNIEDFDPAAAVDSFASIITGVVDAVKWLGENWQGVETGIKAICAAWGTIKMVKGVTTLMELVGGIKGLGAAGTQAAGEAVGASWGKGFAGAVLKAAPWLVFLYTLLNPADTQDDTLTDENGHPTALAQAIQEEQQEKEAELASRTPRQVWLDEMAKKYDGGLGMAVLYREMTGQDDLYDRLQEYWDKYRTGTATPEDWTELQGSMNGMQYGEFLTKMAKFMYSMDRATEDLPDEAFGFNENFDEWLKEYGENGGVPVQVDPTVDEDEAEQLSKKIGVVPVQAEYYPSAMGSNDYDTGFRKGGEDGSEANGIWSVPFDGYRAVLHKGERVVPAREVGSSRNFSSNLYVESMYMNNGQDAQGLAAAMAAAHRRTMSGYGS